MRSGLPAAARQRWWLRMVCAILCGAALCGISALPQTSSAPVTTLEMNVRLVSVYASVTDAAGMPVGNLKATDFALTDNGNRQKIAVFERETNVPINLILALDTSGSVRKDLSQERAAAQRFAQTILRPQDSFSVVSFATDVRQVVPFTNRWKQIQHGLNHLQGGAATALYEAVQRSSQWLAGRSGRKVLVLVTDGGDTADTISYADALDSALRGEVMIYSLIDVPIAASAGRDLGGEHALISLSEQTGGQYFYLDATGYTGSFQKIAADLRTQYLIGYYPVLHHTADAFHRIRITIPDGAKNGFQLRYRSGYDADNVPDPAPSRFP